MIDFGMQGLKLVFVAVYQKGLKLPYVEELLDRMKAEFPNHYQPHVYDYPAFTDSFEKARAELEAAADAGKRRPQPPRSSPIRKVLFPHDCPHMPSLDIISHNVRICSPPWLCKHRTLLPDSCLGLNSGALLMFVMHPLKKFGMLC